MLAEIDGDPSSGFTARDQYITEPSETGPLLDGEYYTLAPDIWGSSNIHNTPEGHPSTVAQFVKDLDYVLGSNNSISLYVCTVITVPDLVLIILSDVPWGD